MRAFRLVDQERAHHAVSVLCSVLKVTRQGYYAWKRRQPSARRLRDDELKADILALYERSRDTYGAPRIKHRLRIEQDIRIGQKRAARLMRELGIQGTGKGQRRVRTTIPDRRAPAAPDRLGRDFTARRPNEMWVADITYIPTHQGWLFLAAVTDCYSRRIVGWSMRDTLEAELVTDAIAMAVARRNPPPGVIHHSDRGSQYGSVLVGRTLREAGIIPSMGHVGDLWDNALMESAQSKQSTCFAPATKPASPCSTTSKRSTTPAAPTAPSGISAPTNTKPSTIDKPRPHKRPHENPVSTRPGQDQIAAQAPRHRYERSDSVPVRSDLVIGGLRSRLVGVEHTPLSGRLGFRRLLRPRRVCQRFGVRACGHGRVRD